MRRPLTMLTLATMCGLLALVAVAALGAKLITSSGASVARTDVGAGPRAWHVTLSPAPDDLALAEISFHAASRERPSTASLHVAPSGPIGDDYMVVAVPRFATPRASRVLVVLVNRPSPLLDPASVRLRITARRSLGVPTDHELSDPFTRPAVVSAARPAVCNLPLHGAPLTGAQLTALVSRGSPPAGLDAANVVAQGYDVACGLPYAAAFERAVEQPSSTSPLPPTPSPPAPTPSTPSPSPPVGKLPGEGCKPEPGYACPG
jgi:hypothetical protein